MIDPLRARVYAMTRFISDPFNEKKLVEVKLTVEPGQSFEGELYLRIPTDDAGGLMLGDVYSFRLTRID